jgi:hypothetical protein
MRHVHRNINSQSDVRICHRYVTASVVKTTLISYKKLWAFMYCSKVAGFVIIDNANGQCQWPMPTAVYKSSYDMMKLVDINMSIIDTKNNLLICCRADPLVLFERGEGVLVVPLYVSVEFSTENLIVEFP